MADKRLERAQKLIKAQRYSAARRILQDIDDPTAKEWLFFVDEIAPSSPKTPWLKRLTRGFLIVLVGGCIIPYLAIATLGRNLEPTRTPTLTPPPATHAAFQPVATRTPPPEPTPTVTSSPSATVEIVAVVATESPTSQPTATPRPTVTKTPAPEPTINPTPYRMMTAEARAAEIAGTQSAQLTPTVILTPVTNTTLYYITADARARRCPDTSCDIIGLFQAGARIRVDGVAIGGRVSGNANWYRTQWTTGEVVYVHVSLVSASAPPTTAPIQAFSSGSQPSQPNQSAGCPSTSFTCSQLTCDQAYACVAAGNRSLDRDRDGVPCESVCPGG
ncbi:MAG: excalibur calcium-binding domain-containing protein [Anaerolineae bacterium]|nr:excalibur calcium-binding domain-containing protein [Anaerolineae bacterium]